MNFPNYKSRDQEMAEIMGIALANNAARAVRGFGVRMDPRKELARQVAAKCRRMVVQGESPQVTFRHMIDRGEVKLVRRRNKPPLLVPIIPKQFRH